MYWMAGPRKYVFTVDTMSGIVNAVKSFLGGSGASSKDRGADENRRRAKEAAEAAEAARRAKETAEAASRRARGSGKDHFSDYSGEPGWMQRISNSTICNWFYTFYLANLIVFILIIGMSAYIYIRHKRHVTAPNLFFALLQLVVVGTNMLFFYLICDRSLKPSL